MYPILQTDKQLGIFQEEKVTQKNLQRDTFYEAICKVDEGEETGFFSELAYDDKITEGKFITSPADINPQVKPKLKDTDITPEWRQRFEELYKNMEKCSQRTLQILGRPQLYKWKLILGATHQLVRDLTVWLSNM